jgi:hypothetical protein
MKKLFILFSVLAVIAAGGAFSQETESTQETESSQETKNSRSGKHSLMIDTVPLFSGIIASDDDMGFSCFGLAFVYEYNVASHYSIGARLGFYAGDLSNTDFSIFMVSLHGRWYPFSEGIEKLFLDVGLGFYSFDVKAVFFTKHTDLTRDLKIGYKLLFNKTFYIEPSIGYMLSDAEMVTQGEEGGGMEGMGEGLGLYKWHIGLGIGWRF